MDEQRPVKTPDKNQEQVSGASSAERRRRAHEILSTQRSKLDRFENELSERLQHLAEEIARDLASHQAEPFSAAQQSVENDEVATLRRQLAARQVELDAARAELEQAEIKTKRVEQDARNRESLLAETNTEQERRVALTACQEQLADSQAQLSAARSRQEELRLELANERERLSTEREETKNQRRRAAREFKAQHAARLEEFERHKAELQALADASNTQLEAQLARASSEMAQTHQAELDAARAELAQAQIKAKRVEQDARNREALLAETHSEQEQRRVALAACQEQLADAQAQLSAARSRQEELRLELANERERLSTDQDKTKTQRRRVARELKARRAADLAEFDQRKAELQALAAVRNTQLEAQLATVNSEMARADQQLAEMRKSLDDRVEELAQARETSQALKAETAELRELLQKKRTEGDRVSDALSQAERAAGNRRGELNELRNQCESLTRQLAAAEAKLNEGSETESGSGNKSDLQRRFEMAVDELREMKLANAELETKLAKARASGSEPSSDDGNGLDWAAQKQRLLASLEADDDGADDDDAEAVAERNTIEGTILITDQIVAQKDREIAEFKRLLEEQSNSSAAAAADASVAEALDHDELIRQEREKLRQIQAEWREKIGKAEIDISMERAKIARDRAELEEKMRSHQHDQATHAPGDPPANAGGKPIRGRWLARLGLKELGE